MQRSASFIRKLNLAEILTEESDESVTELTEAEIQAWTETEIRTYFASAGTERPVAAGSARRRSLKGEVPSEEAFKKWFPSAERLKPAGDAKYVLLCFHNAGNAEDMYTSEGTGTRRAEWCRAEDVECLAPQLPGRGLRRDEACVKSAHDAAAQILAVSAHRNATTPYFVVAHSMGCWVAYEYLILARQRRIPSPRMVFFSGMPSPDLPFEERPWRQQHLLNDIQFQEECRAWDINDVVFSPSLWKTYAPLLRSDFTLFDSYVWEHHTAPPFDFPLNLYWGRHDRRITEAMVQRWARFSTGRCVCHCIEGNHLWPLNKESKQVWLEDIVHSLRTALCT